jgi:hypothetical protein
MMNMVLNADSLSDFLPLHEEDSGKRDEASENDFVLGEADFKL